MARYDERNGQLVPIDKDGKPKDGGKVFGVSMSPRKSFADLTREKQAAAQAGEEGASRSGARSPESPAAAPSFRVTCEKCGDSFGSMELAQAHACEGAPADVEAALNPLPTSPKIQAIAEAAVAKHTCALEGCNVDLSDKRSNARYCSPKCKRRAAYLRRRKTDG